MSLGKLTAILTALFLCSMLAIDAHAKRDTLLDFGGTYVAYHENDDNDVDTEIQRTVLWGSGQAGIPLGGGRYVMFGVAYKGQLIEYHNFDARPLDGEKTRRKDMPNDLHALDFSLGMVWVSAQKKWVTTVQFRPGIHSDFEDIDGGDFIYTGTLLVQRVFGEKNQNMWGLGATYTDLLGKQMVIPLVRLFWYPTEHWFVELTVPVELDVGYRFSRSFSVGIEQKLQGYLYRLTEDDPWNEGVLRYREVQIGPFLDWQFGWKNKMHFRVSGGVSTFQNFEFRDRDNDKKLRDGDMKTAPYGTANFYITF